MRESNDSLLLSSAAPRSVFGPVALVESRYTPALARTILLLCLATPLLLRSQIPDDAAPAPVEASVPAPPVSDDRILGVIPNSQTVSNPETPYVPLHVRDKWELFVKESVDPFAFFSAAAGAGISQWHNGDPRYGSGCSPYLQRFGAAQADLTGQNFFQDAALASLFHEDPRYFREGPAGTVLHRIAHAVSRVAITRRDSGKDSFNFSRASWGWSLASRFPTPTIPRKASPARRWQTGC